MTEVLDRQFNFQAFAAQYDQAILELFRELEAGQYLNQPGLSFSHVKWTKNVRIAFERAAEVVAAARFYAPIDAQEEVDNHILHMARYVRCPNQTYITDLIHSIFAQAEIRLKDFSQPSIRPPTFLQDPPSSLSSPSPYILSKLRGVRERMLIAFVDLDSLREVN